MYRVDRNGKAWILTNEHVVKDSRTVAVRLSGSEGTRSGTVIGQDEVRDLAVLTVCCNGSWRALPTMATNSVRVGSDVAVLGFPGRRIGRDIAVTRGIVSSFGFHEESRSWLIQTDAAINPGNSGGPMMNLRGEVIGIVSSRHDPASAENIGFAIAMRTVDDELDDLEAGRTVTATPTPPPSDFVPVVPSGPAQEGEVTVTITQGVFDPQVVKVKVGTTVIWENLSGAASSATSMDDEAEQWDTEAIWKSAFDREVCCGQHTFRIPGCHRYRSLLSNDTGVGAVCVVE